MTVHENWARNLAYGASAIVAPASVDELAELVGGATRVKALGSRHCFNAIADTDGIHVLTNALPERVEIDGARRVARVAAGMRYGDVAVRLAQQGWALANLASLPHISIAGATATGTHGSGDTVGSLASAVAALELVTADGEIRRFERGDGDFDGVVVSLGLVGVVTAVELDVVEEFDIAQTVYERVPLDAVLADLDAVTGLGYSVSMFTTWQRPDVVDQVWVKSRGEAPDAVLGARPASGKRHPLPGISPDSCTDQLGVPGPWYERLPHFRLAFTPSNGDELQSEYLVPRAHAVAAIDAVRALAPLIQPLLQVCELRTVRRDDLWLSPAYGADVLGIHFTWKPDQLAVEALLPRLEAALASMRARPHWGKLFDLASLPDAACELYPRWPDFTSLRERLDPRGVFGNDFAAALGVTTRDA